MFQQNWHGQLNQSTRARFYRCVKPLHNISYYISNVICKSHRVAMSRLLTSSHSLHVETRRWTRPVTPIENRTCLNCPIKIEDEYHFLLECDLYNDTRKTLIPEYYWKRPSMLKVVQLINSEQKGYIISLAKFVYIAFKIRDTFMASRR